MISIEEHATGQDSPQFIPFSIPWIGEEEIDAVVDCLRSGWLTSGPRVKQFESEFADFIGVRHAVALNSCTAALHLALEALDVQPGEEVIVPTMTFAATAEVVRYLDAKPVLIDCDPRTLNISVDALESYLHEKCEHAAAGLRNRESGSRVRAIIPVHYGGLPCDMRPILDAANEFGLHVIEDAAHAFPATYQGHTIGTLSAAAAFSFYATKNLCTGEGGMLTTNDDHMAERARLMSLHGISKDAWLRYTVRGSWNYEIVEAGFKYNLTDIAAALGIVQLRRANELWKRRKQIARRFTSAFSRLPQLETPVESLDSEHGWHLYPIRLHLESLRIGRAQFIEELRSRGIGASVHFIPLHLHPYYRENFGYLPGDLPVAAREYERIISLPFYPRMSDVHVDRVIDAVTEIAEATAA